MLPKKNKSNEGDGDFESYVRNTLVGIQVDITEIKESQKDIKRLIEDVDNLKVESEQNRSDIKKVDESLNLKVEKLNGESFNIQTRIDSLEDTVQKRTYISHIFHFFFSFHSKSFKMCSFTSIMFT